MAYEPKPNSGTLFRNDRKTADKQPDEKGTALIGGVEYWVSGWWKQGKSGDFLSLAFTVKEQRDGQQDQQPDRQPPAMRQQPAGRKLAQAPADPPFDDQQQFKEDDIPF
jgi:hypothetical protein